MVDGAGRWAREQRIAARCPHLRHSQPAPTQALYFVTCRAVSQVEKKLLDTRPGNDYCLSMPAAQTLRYVVRPVCLSGARPWCAYVKGDKWPSEGRTGRYADEGAAIAAGERMCHRDAEIAGAVAEINRPVA